MDSILTSVKKFIGLEKDQTDFDSQLIMIINGVFAVLTSPKQLGVGPSTGFRINDEYAKWSDFISDDNQTLDIVKDYVSAKTKLKFDPPLSSAHLAALKETIAECEWRLESQADY